MADTLDFLYHIVLPTGRIDHLVRLDAETLEACATDVPAPDWARLEFHVCPNCPLAETGTPDCPMAKSLAGLLEDAGKAVSHDKARVVVQSGSRTISADTTAQRAFGSLMGLVMATCGCPEMAWLRPMARFHLPLANEEETLYRAASMYLVAQYFRSRRGAAPDLDLEGLRQHYRRVHEINMAMADRLRAACEKDAPVNAVILLDMFAKILPWSIDESLAEIEYLFRPWLADLAPISLPPETG
jgi:hypothetical protein